MLRDLLETEEFQKSTSKIAFAAGRDIAGKVVVADIMKMPHLLIAGATGSGKSVCINTLIMSILYKAIRQQAEFIMIYPKVVELSVAQWDSTFDDSSSYRSEESIGSFKLGCCGNG